jgi:hypothetical protein
MVFIDINGKFRSHVHCIISKDKAINNRSIVALKDKTLQEEHNTDEDIHLSQLLHIIDKFLQEV